MSQDNIKFAYWVPNVSGGLVVSKIQQRTRWYFTNGNPVEGIKAQVDDIRAKADPQAEHATAQEVA
jgi:hypothetical protein